MVNIKILPEGISISTKTGTPLIDALNENGVLVNLPCGGDGRCGKCVVSIAPANGANNLPNEMMPDHEEKKHLSDESLKSGLRLACRVTVSRDIEVMVPLSSRVAGAGRSWEEFEVKDKDSLSGRDLYLAVDVGTTSIAVAIVDIVDIGANDKTGGIIAHASALNPQVTFGADVISRINAVAIDEKNLKRQQQLVLDTINELVAKLTGKLGIDPKDIKGATFAGNPTMEHLLLGINPISISQAPFTPAFTGAVEKKAKDLGLNINPDGVAYVFPVFSGYVGGDTLAFIWSSRIHESKDIILGIDIGTNGEIVLGNIDRLICCSAAAGPAFEGSQIRDGMRADFGAIEGVVINGDDIELAVKGDGTGGNNETPIGICGSGIFDAVDQLIKAKVIKESGRITKDDVSPVLAERIQRIDSIVEFTLYNGNGTTGGTQKTIGITQKDIREVQLAKGAMRAGVEILLGELGIQWDDIKTVLIAGAFGNFLKPESIVGVGLIPKEMKDKIKFVGDAALTGAVEGVLDEKIDSYSSNIKSNNSINNRSTNISTKKGIERLAETIDYVELSSDKSFNDLFIKRLPFED